MRRLAAALPRLVDTDARDHAAVVLAGIADASVAAMAGLSYAKGHLESVAERNTEAIAWLVRAQATVDPADQPLVARIAFELGYAHIKRQERLAADAALAWGEGLCGGAAADLAHLRAMLAEDVGDYAAARPLYREAVRLSSSALTPLTRALALTNLAVALHHVDPHEGAALCGLALSTLEAEQLHPGARPAVRNVRGYALLCLGRFREARLALEEAAREAAIVRYRRIALYTAFNTAILNELEGKTSQSLDALRAIAVDATEAGLDALALWARLRQAWMHVKVGEDVEGRQVLAHHFSARVPPAHAAGLAVLQAILALHAGEAAAARESLRELEQSCLRRDDHLTHFVILLWAAHLEREAGRPVVARRLVRRACRIGGARGFVVSPNWWAGEIVATARALAEEDLSAYVHTLVVGPDTAPAGRPNRPILRITPSADVFIDGTPLPAGAWREGRTGSRVLRRLFWVIVTAHPRALRREEIADALWPDSDGDRALANFFSAMNDLRRFLSRLPGLMVTSRSGRYCLEFEPNVSLGPPADVTE
ncbi:MAG: hypothetical protein ACRDF0_04225 [Candidatus Limnocylindria bacterium]